MPANHQPQHQHPNTHMPQGKVYVGAAVGLDPNTLPGLEFDPSCEYSGCRLCGAVYQSDLDRQRSHDFWLWCLVSNEARAKRDRWKALHTRRYHTDKEVDYFKGTRLAFTPEAANKLAPLGAFSATDAVLNEEVAQALLEAPRAPHDDVEGT